MKSWCVYHSDKFLFNDSVKALQKLKILSKPQADKYAMAVCSCRRKVQTERGTSDTSELWTLQQNICHQLQTREFDNTYTNIAVDFLTNVIYQHLSQISAQLFLTILSQALQGNYNQLTKSADSRSHGTRKNKHSKFNEASFRCLMARKKRNAVIKTKICLPLFGGNSKYLQQDPNIGKNFRVIGQKWNSVICINGADTGTMMSQNKTGTVLNVYCDHTATVDLLQGELNTIARTIQSGHQKPTKLHKKRYRYPGSWDYHIENRSTDLDRIMDLTELKLDLTDTYSLKNKMKRKRSRNNKASKNKRNGPCLHCMKTYRDVRKNGDQKCQYHSGYSVESYDGGMWNCCNESIESPGCLHGEHLWRWRFTDKRDWKKSLQLKKSKQKIDMDYVTASDIDWELKYTGNRSVVRKNDITCFSIYKNKYRFH